MRSFSLPHLLIRKYVTEKYLATTSKRIKIYKEYVTDLFSSYSFDDYIDIKINRTNIDRKILSSVVVEINDVKIKEACEYGVIDQWWSLDSVVKIIECSRSFASFQDQKIEQKFLL